MLRVKKYLTVAAFILFAGNSKYVRPLTGYNLAAPNTILILPEILREVSGCAFLDSVSFACIQDERGMVFIYDLSKNKIKDQYNFNIDGDYEGVTNVGNKLFILRSDGVLFEISDYKSKSFKVKSYNTGIPAPNNEGLCYDEENNRLLIASKGRIGKGPELKDKRIIYGFDLNTYRLERKPAFDFNMQKIKAFAASRKIPLRESVKKNGEKINEPMFKLNTSAICIHPFTKELYLLSATDHLLFIFDMKGNILNIQALDANVFNKPEGISFNEKGDMLITNEGQHKKPTAILLKYIQ